MRDIKAVAIHSAVEWLTSFAHIEWIVLEVL